mgnify:CR=1 FL=1
MNIEEMNMEQVEARVAEIRAQLDGDGEIDATALNAELDQLEARRQAIESAAEERRAIRERVAGMTFPAPVAEANFTQERSGRMNPEVEIRNTPAYIQAYANYIRTGDDRECRALLTENASGAIQVPSLVDDVVRTAWNRDGVMARVKKSYLKGNLRVSFEISGTEATKHTEGAAAVSEEPLVLGVVELKPASIKKWISLSDEAIDLTGEAFLRYIYDELTYRIAKKAAKELIGLIEACGTVSTTTCVGVPVVTASTVAVGTIAKAMAKLAEEAPNPVIIMNRETEAAFKGVQYAGSFSTDIFEGLPRVYSSALKAFSAATSGDTYAIVGDLGRGAQANFPNGNEISIKFDDLSLAEKDLVKIVGREFVALGVVGPGCFVNITK